MVFRPWGVAAPLVVPPRRPAVDLVTCGIAESATMAPRVRLGAQLSSGL